MILGLGESIETLSDSFAVAGRYHLVKGFAVGRTIFAEAAQAWLKGEIDDAAAIETMGARYNILCSAWDRARGSRRN